MHLKHKAGDKCFVDFAGETLPVVNRDTGEITETEVFVAILAASQVAYVEEILSNVVDEKFYISSNMSLCSHLLS